MGATTTFISYSHHDDKLVTKVTRLLRTQGNEIFFDKDSILPGEKWHEKLEIKIREADQLIVFWCCHSAESDWVAREMLLGMLLKKPIIPILCCDFPVDSKIKEFQWIDFKGILNHKCSHFDQVHYSLPSSPQKGPAGSLLRLAIVLIATVICTFVSIVLIFQSYNLSDTEIRINDNPLYQYWWFFVVVTFMLLYIFLKEAIKRKR